MRLAAVIVSSARPIHVVCAILHDDAGRVLLAQRPVHKHLGLKWEFAGGKVEAGESAAGALAREIHEELGCEIDVGRALPAFLHDYGTVLIEMLPFVCTLKPGSAAPHPHEHIAVQWVGLDAIDSVDLAPADWPIVAMLRTQADKGGTA